MQEATFLILTALAAGAQHGYGIITDVKDISGGRVRLRAGTLYTALDRLRTEELIGVDREEVVDGRLVTNDHFDVVRRGEQATTTTEANGRQALTLRSLRRVASQRPEGRWSLLR